MVAAAAAVSTKMPNTQKTYEVSRADLPVSCPLPDMMLWNSHPKVYLPSKPPARPSARIVVRISC
jgi:uncharacterized Zn-finger protein